MTLTKPKVLVIGDIILDVYTKVTRTNKTKNIYPHIYKLDALTSEPRSRVLGGAANVALNLKELGAEVSIVGLVGKDSNAEIVASLLNHKKIVHELVVRDKYVTVTKERVMVVDKMSGNFRIDYELDPEKIELDIDNEVMSCYYNLLDEVDVVVISDYGKGIFCHSDLCKKIIYESKKQGIAVYVDPKQMDPKVYYGAKLIKPNQPELESMLDYQTSGDSETLTDTEIYQMCKTQIIDKYKIQYVLMTRNREGALLLSTDSCRRIPPACREVEDANGAGDTMIAVLAFCGGSEKMQFLEPPEASLIASVAASCVIQESGTNTTSWNSILRAYQKRINKSESALSRETTKLLKKIGHN